MKRPEKNRHKRLKTSSRTGRPNEYPKAPVRVPQTGKPDRQAIRIPQSSQCECLKIPSRTGRLNEYLKAPVRVPRTGKSHRQAQRILQSIQCECLEPTSRTGRPNEYPKASVRVPRTGKSYRRAKRIPQSSRASASNRQVEPASHTKAKRIPQSSRASASNRQVVPAGHTNTSKLQCERLKIPSRTGRPYEYLKAPVQMPQKPKSYRQAKRIPQSSRHKCLQPTSRRRQANHYFLATSMTAAMMRAMPRRSQAPKRRWKRKKEKMTDETGSMAPMILVSAGRM